MAVAIIKKQWFFALLCFALAVTSHHSYKYFAVILILSILIADKVSYKLLYCCVGVGIFFSFFPMVWILNMMRLVVVFFASTLGRYLIEDGFFTGDINLINKLSRLCFVPLYLLSIKFSRQAVMSNTSRILFNFGVILYSIRLASMSFGVFFRLAHGCEILMVFPLAFLLSYLYKNHRDYASITALVMFSYYFVKVVLYAQGEYSYSSYYFANM